MGPMLLLQRALLCLALSILILSVSCTVETRKLDVSSVAITFEQPQKSLYQNKTGYGFKVDLATAGISWKLENAHLQVFESADCSGDPILEESFSENGSAEISSGNFADGKKYSAQVQAIRGNQKFVSNCSPWIGVDTQAPDSVTVHFPVVDQVTSSKSFTALWSSSQDHGISGLSETPYRVQLYSQANCAGPVIRTVMSSVPQFHFDLLVHNATYSVQVFALDRAGNESSLSCSSFVEIDENMPGFTVQDPNSVPGYSRGSSPEVTITNDPTTAYWCFTEDLTFVPTSAASVCPGGNGPHNGWYDSRPSTTDLSAGEGSKIIKLWIADGNGDLISINPPSVAITRDSVPPVAAVVPGIAGGTDAYFDEWYTSLGDPKVRWVPGADTYDADFIVLDSGSQVVCTLMAVPVAQTDVDLVGCALTNNEVYKLRITAHDMARNPQVTDFDFTVKRDPPGPFLIQGLSGNGDSLVDEFLGDTLPVVTVAASATAARYKARILTADGTAEVCSLAVSTSTTIDFATAPGAVCSALLHGQSYVAEVFSEDAGFLQTAAGNQNFAFTVDTQDPVLTLEPMAVTLLSLDHVELRFDASDDLSGMMGMHCSLDGGAWNVCLSPLNLTSLSEGAHELRVRALDRAGNQTVDAFHWIVDLTDPVLTLTSVPPAMTANMNLSVSFSATDANAIDHFECSLDADPFVSCTSPVALIGAPGLHTYHVVAYDKSGRSQQQSTNFLVDVTAPQVDSLTGPPNPDHNQLSPSFSFTVSDAGGAGIASVECSLDGGAWSACASPRTVSIAAGDHHFILRVTDGAGNVTFSSDYAWTAYTYTWSVPAWGACSAAQPSWQTGGWGGCSVGQPQYQYGGWGGCSASCDGGWQYRGESCPVVWGSQSRSVSCPTNSGTQTRTVTCQRNDGATVADGFCLTAKPAGNQSCSRNDCAGGAPPSSQSCSRGGGGDCWGQQGTAQSCNTQACYVNFDVYSPGGCINGYCICSQPGPCGVPYQLYADRICQYRGYARASGFGTAPGPNANQCAADGTSCYVSGNAACNIVCTTVTCTNL